MVNKERGYSLIGFIALCQSRSFQTKRGIRGYPASVLASGSALGSLPSVALSSAQRDRILLERKPPRRQKISPCHHSVACPIAAYKQSSRGIFRDEGGSILDYERKRGLPALQAKE